MCLLATSFPALRPLLPFGITVAGKYSFFIQGIKTEYQLVFMYSAAHYLSSIVQQAIGDDST